jgi:hypothetical protein
LFGKSGKFTMSETSRNSRLDSINNLSEELQTTIPTNNLSRSALGELIGSLTEYHTGCGWNFEAPVTLHIEANSASRFSTVDVVRALNPEELNAVREVEYPEDLEYESNTYSAEITIKFH